MKKENIILTSALSDVPIFSVCEAAEPAQDAHGELEKGLLILSLAGVEAAERELLSKILTAVRYDLEKDALLLEQEAHLPLNLPRIFRSKTIERIIVFGLAPAQLGLSIDIVHYRPLVFLERQFLFAHSLPEIASDKTLKSALWKALQQMF